MSTHTNELGQPVGFPMPDWKPARIPDRTPMEGRYCRVEAIAPEHRDDLYEAFLLDTDGRNWTYLSQGPFDSRDAFDRWYAAHCADPSRITQAIRDRDTGRAIGIASYLRVDPAVGSIEVGYINFAPPLQRTRMATEAMYLMMARVFDELGYRRYEWKCDSLNAPSRSAALRLGFTYEGRFRQATIYKNRNRDTDWLSILDSEWPAIRRGFEVWLDRSNFDAARNQRASLSSLIDANRKAA
ncbi:MAG: GNAT family protein [Alphaproteobacteria bacterium]